MFILEAKKVEQLLVMYKKIDHPFLIDKPRILPQLKSICTQRDRYNEPKELNNFHFVISFIGFISSKPLSKFL